MPWMSKEGEGAVWVVFLVDCVVLVGPWVSEAVIDGLPNQPTSLVLSNNDSNPLRIAYLAKGVECAGNIMPQWALKDAEGSDKGGEILEDMILGV